MVTLDGIELPGLVWENELDWSGIQTEVDYSLANVPIVWEEIRSKGRPINLIGTEHTGLLQRQTLLDLLALSGVVGKVAVFHYKDRDFNVRFRHEDTPVISGEPLVGREKTLGTDFYKNIIVKLMEV